MKGRFIHSGKSVIALIVCIALFVTGLPLPAFAETGGAAPAIASGVKTWQDAAEYICGLLGEQTDDALGALRTWNYLEEDVSASDAVSAEQLQAVLRRVFGAVIDGDESLSAARQTENANLYVTAQVKKIGSLTADHLVFESGARAQISAVNARSLPITGAAELELAPVRRSTRSSSTPIRTSSYAATARRKSARS